MTRQALQLSSDEKKSEITLLARAIRHAKLPRLAFQPKSMKFGDFKLYTKTKELCENWAILYMGQSTQKKIFSETMSPNRTKIVRKEAYGKKSLTPKV